MRGYARGPFGRGKSVWNRSAIAGLDGRCNSDRAEAEMDGGMILKELKIADIKVGSRHRKDMGDLTSLAGSIRQDGFLQPIGVTEKLELVRRTQTPSPPGLTQQEDDS